MLESCALSSPQALTWEQESFGQSPSVKSLTIIRQILQLLTLWKRQQLPYPTTKSHPSLSQTTKTRSKASHTRRQQEAQELLELLLSKELVLLEELQLHSPL